MLGELFRTVPLCSLLNEKYVVMQILQTTLSYHCMAKGNAMNHVLDMWFILNNHHKVYSHPQKVYHNSSLAILSHQNVLVFFRNSTAKTKIIIFIIL